MPAYIGVNGKARGIAKVYKGNSEGKAEMIWGPKGLCHYSKDVAGLSTPRYSLCGNSTFGEDAYASGDYALFAGGLTQTSSTDSPISSNVVDVYDKTLTRSTATPLRVGRSGMVSAKNEKYLIFIGSDEYSNASDAYDKTLARTELNDAGVVRKLFAACGCSRCAIFAGGITSSGYSNVVDTYDSSLTRRTIQSLSEAKSNLVGVAPALGAYSLFAGGYTGSNYVSTVEMYMMGSIKRNNAAALSVAKSGCVAVHLDVYGIIAGGGGLSRSNTVDVYDNNASKVTAAPLTSTSTNMVATELRDAVWGVYAIFCGFSNSKYFIDAYDGNLTKVSVKIGTARNLLAAASVGDYALFAGGEFNSVSRSTVDAFHVFK